MKIALVVGHSESKRGAVGVAGKSEWFFNDKLAKDIVKELSEQYGINDVKIFYRDSDDSGYTEKMKILHKRIDKYGANYSISMHFNSSSMYNVSGHEVIYCSRNGKKVAEVLNSLFNVYLDNRDRGVKKVKKRGRGFLCRGKSICIIAEPYFAYEQLNYDFDTYGYQMLKNAYIDLILELQNK